MVVICTPGSLHRAMHAELGFVCLFVCIFLVLKRQMEGRMAVSHSLLMCESRAVTQTAKGTARMTF